MSNNIVFMGTPEFSVTILESLVKSNFDIECVYTQSPKKSLRGQKIHSSPVQKISEKLNIKLRSPNNLTITEELNFFRSLSSKIIIVVAYGKLIPKAFLNLPDKIFLNVHPSLLPRWRGAAPIQRSIMSLDKETGVSIMKIVEGLDTGPYIKQVKVKIDDKTTTKSLSEKLSSLGAKAVIESINLIKKGEYKFINQDHNQATYAKKINKSESKIIWNEPAKNILAKINALNPSPGAWFEYNGNRFKIWKANIKNNQGSPGEVLDKKLVIGCGEKSIQVTEIQKEGKKVLSLDEFLSGNKISIGEKIL